MTEDMDGLIRATAPEQAARLAGLEEAVWARVDDHEARSRALQVRIAVIAFALVLGGANGSLILLAPRPAPSEMRVFTAAAGLAPLTSADVRG